MNNPESPAPPAAAEDGEERTAVVGQVGSNAAPASDDTTEAVDNAAPDGTADQAAPDVEPTESVEGLIEAGKVPALVVTALEEARGQVKAAEDRVLRMLAETENTRKRLVKDREDSVRYANERFVREMLPVADNLERCLGHSETEIDPGKLKKGVELTLKQLHQTLKGFGVEKVEAEIGEPFDAATQEAVMQDSSSKQPAKTITAIVEPGYTYRERLLRAAKVVVATGTGEDLEGKTEEETGGDEARDAESTDKEE